MDGNNVCAAIRAKEKAQIGIAGAPSKQWALNFEPLFEDNFVVIFNPEHYPLTPDKPITWDELQHYPLILNGASNVIKSDAFQTIGQKCHTHCAQFKFTHGFIECRRRASLFCLPYGT